MAAVFCTVYGDGGVVVVAVAVTIVQYRAVSSSSTCAAFNGCETFLPNTRVVVQGSFSFGSVVVVVLLHE